MTHRFAKLMVSERCPWGVHDCLFNIRATPKNTMGKTTFSGGGEWGGGGGGGLSVAADNLSLSCAA